MKVGEHEAKLTRPTGWADSTEGELVVRADSALGAAIARKSGPWGPARNAQEQLVHVRMALSDRGYHPEKAFIGNGGFVSFADDVPIDVAWAACSLTTPESGGQVCLAHYRVSNGESPVLVQRALRACVADRPLVRDCGSVEHDPDLVQP